jgi:hypothetical protein
MPCGVSWPLAGDVDHCVMTGQGTSGAVDPVTGSLNLVAVIADRSHKKGWPATIAADC